MAFPQGLSCVNEADFVDRILVPLLFRMGFFLVANYHGTQEFGKDVVFADTDRFGHIRYYGLQAKYRPSISVNDIGDLVTDCKQAFANPFRHPQTGTMEHISCFYAMNGGSFADGARTHFFNSLEQPYRTNSRLIDGAAIISLDRWAAFTRHETLGAILSGLRLDLTYNARYPIPEMKGGLAPAAAGITTLQLRTEAASSYLRTPVAPNDIDTDDVLTYWHLAMIANKRHDLVFQGTMRPEYRQELAQATLRTLDQLEECARRIQASLERVLASLGSSLNTIGPVDNRPGELAQPGQ